MWFASACIRLHPGVAFSTAQPKHVSAFVLLLDVRPCLVLLFLFGCTFALCVCVCSRWVGVNMCWGVLMPSVFLSPLSVCLLLVCSISLFLSFSLVLTSLDLLSLLFSLFPQNLACCSSLTFYFVCRVMSARKRFSP